MRLDQADLNLFVRETFGDELFVRIPGGMKPTPVTDNVIVRVREALKLLGSSLSEHQRFDPAVATTTFRVAMGDMAEALYLPGLLRRLQELAPGISWLFARARKGLWLRSAVLR